MDKWTDGQNTEGKSLTLILPMKLDKRVTEKNGVKKTFESLAGIGSKFGGVQIGMDNDGNRIMANVSIYRKPLKTDTPATQSAYKIG